MHCDLSPHLHTEECNKLIELFHKCHKDHPFKKFLGHCNDIDAEMGRCLRKERIARQKASVAKARANMTRRQAADSS